MFKVLVHISQLVRAQNVLSARSINAGDVSAYQTVVTREKVIVVFATHPAQIVRHGVDKRTVTEFAQALREVFKLGTVDSGARQ